MNPLPSRFVLLAMLVSTQSRAASSGDQAPIPDQAIPCTKSEFQVAQQTISVSVTSRVLINARLQISSGTVTGFPGYEGTMHVRVSHTGAQVGDTGYATVGLVAYSVNGAIWLTADKFALATASSSPATLAPGFYDLAVIATYSCGNSNDEATIRQGTLGWVLLSSAYDRIFADGFGATG